MKKYLYLLVGLLSFLGISTVKADTLTYDYFIPWVVTADVYTNSSSEFSHCYDLVYDYYQQNFINEYPYYSLYMSESGGYLELDFIAHPTPVGLNYSNDSFIMSYVNSSLGEYSDSDQIFITVTYNENNSGSYNLIYPGTHYSENYIFQSSDYIPRYYYYSNFDLINLSDNTINVSQYSVDYPGFTVLPNGIIPTYQSLLNLNIINDPNSPSSTYQEINLNNYSYVALSLKDYSLRNNNNNQFYTNVYVKGQYCLTPVYNYGMTEKTEYYSGYQVDRCSTYYSDFTAVRTYILKQDLENNAIYYLKAYDTSKDNIVKVDTSIFDISYITSENASSPTVTINGKSYPTIAYDDLTSTATKSEDEDYISGVVCAVGDANCYSENALDSSFSDLFSNPLKTLKTVWTTITAIFTIITEFILLLPPTMQGFLYVAFGIGIALGIIKILL